MNNAFKGLTDGDNSLKQLNRMDCCPPSYQYVLLPRFLVLYHKSVALPVYCQALICTYVNRVNLVSVFKYLHILYQALNFDKMLHNRIFAFKY